MIIEHGRFERAGVLFVHLTVGLAALKLIAHLLYVSLELDHLICMCCCSYLLSTIVEFLFLVLLLLLVIEEVKLIAVKVSRLLLRVGLRQHTL